MGIHFSSGEKHQAIAIMREAAQWLIDTGRPMWDEDDLSLEKLNNPSDEFWVMRDGTEDVGAMILCYEDKFYWPDIPPDTSGFVHKLSVCREYVSKGCGKILLEHAKKICKEKGITHLRLDCDSHREGLIRFYKSCGFALVEMRVLDTEKWGTIEMAMFETECR